MASGGPNLRYPGTFKPYDLAHQDTQKKRNEEAKLTDAELGLRIARELEEAGFVLVRDVVVLVADFLALG
jgi:hypothetical protein